MALILNIDTATEVASACLSDGSQLLAIRENHQQKEHASFINVAIGEIFNEANLPVNLMEAVAVTIGPGSYTGLRVGLATAKGFCYALKVPLITLMFPQVALVPEVVVQLFKSKVVEPVVFPAIFKILTPLPLLFQVNDVLETTVSGVEFVSI